MMKRIKDNLSVIYQSIIIITVVFNIVFWPVKTISHYKFKEVDAKITAIREDMKEFASLDVTNMKLEQLCKDLSKLVKQIEKCQEADDEFRREFYKFLGKEEGAN